MADPTKNVEISKYWTFNQTGNIMVSSTVQEEKDLRDAVIEEFQKVAVLYDAISTAIARSKKTYQIGSANAEVSLGMFDYSAISNIMAKCGWFALMHEEDRKFSKSSSSISIDVAMISEMLSAFTGAGPVLDMMKNVIRSIGAKLNKVDMSTSSSHKDIRVGHILFVCEDCMGMPLISVQVISTSLDQLTWVATTPCVSTQHAEINTEYKMETFMFIDPVYIAKFSHEFKSTADFDKLVSDLEGYINT